MTQRDALLITAGHQAFAALDATDIPSLSASYDAAGAAAAAQAAAATDATTKANAAQAASWPATTAFDATSPANIGTAAAGAAAKAAHRDHVHGTGAGTPTTSAVGDSAATGTGPAAAMTNHVHGREAFGSSAAAVGTSSAGAATTPSRSDHVHATGAGTPSTQAFGDAAATGTGPAASMTDHKHAMPANPFSGASAGGSLSGTYPNPTVATNANLTGNVTSVGNATTIAAGVVTEAMQVLADNTTNDVSTTAHGYAPKIPSANTGYHLSGTGWSFDVVGQGQQSLGIRQTANFSADQNNYNPGSTWATQSVFDLTANSAGLTITGFTAGSSVAGEKWVHNVGTFAFTIAHQSASSSNGNRVNCPGSQNFLVGPGMSVLIQHTASNYWLHAFASSEPYLPTVRAVSAEAHGTGTVSLTLPAGHVANDIVIVAVQSSNESIATPAGYTQMGPQNGIGVNVVAGASRLGLFWVRDTGSLTDPLVLADSGDHTYATAIAITGCPTTGDPFHFLGNSAKFATSTAGSGVSGATSIDNCLILDIWAQHLDATGAQISGSAANADLASVTTQFDGSTTDGTGGGIVIISGIKSVAGPFTNTTFTWGTTTADLNSVIAMLPIDPSRQGGTPHPVEVQTFIGGAPDLDDTWVKPTGAREIFVQLCDGGGSGSGGNTATTAAGGGGGGGGGYDQAQYVASLLAATISVHAGKGGAVGTGLNQAGNPGVVSEFDKGGRGPLTSAYRIAGVAATAAASADGGNGGSGSGRGTLTTAVATTRITLEGVTAGAALGFKGGAGGSGTTAPTGGSPAEGGGGGGESGADTDAATTSLLNGYSLQGGGGGSSGRTNGTISGSGAGGGAPGVINAQGGSGTDSTHWPYGGSGGIGGGSGTVTGGSGGFPGGGGGGGAGVAGGFGGRGGHGCVVVTTTFS